MTKTILVVDDSLDRRSHISATIRNNGYNPLVVPTLYEALDIIRWDINERNYYKRDVPRPIDGLVTDLQLDTPREEIYFGITLLYCLKKPIILKPNRKEKMKEEVKDYRGHILLERAVPDLRNEWKEKPVILISGMKPSFLRNIAEECGADGYVSVKQDGTNASLVPQFLNYYFHTHEA